MVEVLSVITIVIIGVPLLSILAMQRIGPRLIYKISSIGLDREASHRRPQWARKEESMAWTTPTLVEICIGLEINGYLPAEF